MAVLTLLGGVTVHGLSLYRAGTEMYILSSVIVFRKIKSQFVWPSREAKAGVQIVCNILKRLDVPRWRGMKARFAPPASAGMTEEGGHAVCQTGMNSAERFSTM